MTIRSTSGSANPRGLARALDPRQREGDHGGVRHGIGKTTGAGQQRRPAGDDIVHQHDASMASQRALHRQRPVVLAKRRPLQAARALGHGMHAIEGRAPQSSPGRTDAAPDRGWTLARRSAVWSIRRGAWGPARCRRQTGCERLASTWAPSVRSGPQRRVCSCPVAAGRA